MHKGKVTKISFSTSFESTAAKPACKHRGGDEHAEIHWCFSAVTFIKPSSVKSKT